MSNRRQADLAKIHLAKKQLGLDEETYRDMLGEVAGARSARDLDAAGRRKVLQHLERCGFRLRIRPRPGQFADTPHTLGSDPQLQKIEALLAHMKLPWAYAHAIARRMWGVQRLEWVDDTRKKSAVIAALHREARKRAEGADRHGKDERQ